MARLSDDDHRLSMRLSRRGKQPDPPGLRSLLVHRLSDTAKLVLRRALRHEQVGGYCEPCDDWTLRGTDQEAFPRVMGCVRCGRRFRLEFAIYEEID